MKAVICTRYGGPDVLQLQDIPKPAPKANEVLIRIRTTTVTAGDCQLRRFDLPALFWLPLRLYIGITKPRKGIFGQELAGDVEAVGDTVTRFKPGDAVFAYTAMGMGGYAEYICLPERYLTPFNPDKMTYASAATIPTGGINGLHFVRKGAVHRDERVLINGAGGSIGTCALQFAKAAGAHVTCVDSANKLAMLRDLGADEVIDYTREDFTRNGKSYDVIIDVAGTSPYSRSLRALAPRGRYVLGNPSLTGMLRGLWTSAVSDKKVLFEFAGYKPEDLAYIRDEVERGALKTFIDRTYSLAQLPEAHRYVEAGKKCGNLVITTTP